MNISNDFPTIWVDLRYGFDFNFNIEKTENGYTYNTVFVQKKERNMLIQSLIHDKYSVDDEIALNNNYNAGLNLDKYAEYQEYRVTCKNIANKEFE